MRRPRSTRALAPAHTARRTLLQAHAAAGAGIPPRAEDVMSGFSARRPRLSTPRRSRSRSGRETRGSLTWVWHYLDNNTSPYLEALILTSLARQGLGASLL